MSRKLLLLTVLALAAGTVTVPVTPAAAQCRLCDTPTTRAEERGGEGPVSLEIETSLDFDRLILLGVGEGSATLLPNGSRSVSGVIGEISGRAMVGKAVIHGEAGRAVRIDLPRRIELHSLSGGRIVIEDIISDLPGSARLDSGGRLYFRFGGRLRVSGDDEGEYRGDVPLTVEYL
jgi:hypothetical protein